MTSISAPASDTKPRTMRGQQPVLVLLLLLVGIGNLVLADIRSNVILANYLTITLGLVFLAILFRLPTIISNAHYLPVVLVFAVSFVPGFLTTELSSYGTTKLMGAVIAFILIMAPAALIRPERSVPLLFSGIIIVSLVMTLLLMTQGFQGIAGRSQIEGLNPIATGRVSVMMSVIAVGVLLYYWGSVRRLRLVLVILSLLGVTGAIMTGSRGPLLSALIALVLFLPVLLITRRLTSRAVAAMGFAMATLVSVLSFADLPGLDRILGGDDTGRSFLYEESLQLALANPVGIGWGSLADYIQWTNQAVDGRLYSHNIFLEVAVEGGWIALIGLIILLVAALRSSFKGAMRGDRAAPLVYLMLIFLLANAQFSSDIVGNRLLWLFVGLALVVRDTSSRET